ncbi:FecR family protein [Sphingomonas sp. XXL09]|uniref:FecR family protein n=1 Tax=Sphingomonas sp. XXL09 TaxID=3457787 RepID=UPI00406BA3DB
MGASSPYGHRVALTDLLQRTWRIGAIRPSSPCEIGWITTLAEGCLTDDGAQTLREAADWLARHRTGRIDEAAFARWRDASPAHALAFCRVLALWRAEPADAVVAPSFPQRHGLFGQASRRDLVRAGAIAGVGAILAGGVIVAPAYAWHSATTEVGGSRRILLPDGSGVELNTDTRLSWRFSASERVFWLEKGEVCMTLRSGPLAVLRGGPAPIVMTSGLFNLRLHGDGVELLVMEGGARIEGADRTRATIVAGSAAPNTAFVAPRDMRLLTTRMDQVDATTAWRDHAIVFQDVPLHDAVREYNRYLARKIVILDPELADTPVGGRFETGDPTAFLNAVAIGLGIHVTPSARGYSLAKSRVTQK